MCCAIAKIKLSSYKQAFDHFFTQYMTSSKSAGVSIWEWVRAFLEEGGGTDWGSPLCSGVLKSIQAPRTLGTTVHSGGTVLGMGRLGMLWGWRGNMFLWHSWEACGNEEKEGELVAQLRVS